MKNFFIYGYDKEGSTVTQPTIPDRSVVKLTTGQVGVVFGGNLYLRTEVVPIKDVQIEKVWDYPALYESINNVSQLVPPVFDSGDVDWDSIPVDTRVEIRVNGVWKHAYFAGCFGGVPYYFIGGRNSYTAPNDAYGSVTQVDKKDIRLFKKGL